MATSKEKVRAKVIELLDDIRPTLEQKLDNLLDSGTIDFDKEPDNWGLPKDIVQALAEELKFQYMNINATRTDKKRINNYYNTIRNGR